MADALIVGGLPVISIHALLAESDARCKQEMETYKISIHALLAESDSQHVTWPSG